MLSDILQLGKFASRKVREVTLMCLINVLGRISVLGGHTAHLFSTQSVENEFSTIVCLIIVPGRLLGTLFIE